MNTWPILAMLQLASASDTRRVTHSSRPITTPVDSLLAIGSPHPLGPVHNRHAIILDAGSAGTRINLYELQYAGDQMLSLVDEVYVRVKPGLSDFADDPTRAIESLRPLIELAKARIPAPEHASTSLALKATAGLRLLSGLAADTLLAALRAWLEREPFLLLPDAVSIMDGMEEGVNGWVTCNFLAELMGTEQSMAVVELGGGSVQMVFDAGQPDAVLPQYYHPLQFNDHSHLLYQHSYLGYGLGEMRKAVKRLALKEGNFNGGKLSAGAFPFYPVGFKDAFEGGVLEGSSGSFAECYALAKAVFPMEEPCAHPPCTFAGVHQPPLPSSMPLVGTCYFYSRLSTLSLPSPFTLGDLEREAALLCAAHSELNGLPCTEYGRLLRANADWALDICLIYALLAHGLQLSREHPILVLDDVKGYKLGWTFGAALQLLRPAQGR